MAAQLTATNGRGAGLAERPANTSAVPLSLPLINSGMSFAHQAQRAAGGGVQPGVVAGQRQQVARQAVAGRRRGKTRCRWPPALARETAAQSRASCLGSALAALGARRAS